MPIKRGHLYVIDFNPRIKTKPGKLRPALVIQSDLVNEAEYPSTIVVPTTTRLVENAGILRFRLKKNQGGIRRDSDLLLGQMIAVANESFRQEIGTLPDSLMDEVENRVSHHSKPVKRRSLANLCLRAVILFNESPCPPRASTFGGIPDIRFRIFDLQRSSAHV
jgi:mRNA interferase MazF